MSFRDEQSDDKAEYTDSLISTIRPYFIRGLLTRKLKRTVVILSAILLVSFCAASAGLRANAASSGDDWSMFHHDLAHTGYSTSSALTTPVVLWTTPKGYGGSPVVSNGYVYILDLGNLYCIRASDGHQVWNQSLPAGLPDSSPAVYEGYIYTPLTAYNANTGKKVLDYSDYQGYTSPTVTEGVIYFGSHFSKSIFALNATTGSKIWNYLAGEVTSSPAIAHGHVYFASGDGNIYALDALTGTKIWNYPFPPVEYYMLSSPAIVNGVVYAGNGHALYAFGNPTPTPTSSPSTPLNIPLSILILVAVVVIMVILAVLLLVYRIRRKGTKSSTHTA